MHGPRYAREIVDLTPMSCNPPVTLAGLAPGGGGEYGVRASPATCDSVHIIRNQEEARLIGSKDPERQWVETYHQGSLSANSTFSVDTNEAGKVLPIYRRGWKPGRPRFQRRADHADRWPGPRQHCT
jgi:hypothetical protein